MKYRKPLWIAGIVLPPLLLACFIGVYGVNTPWLDDWYLVPLLEKYESGDLPFSDLWAQHNEHRILFPKLIMIGLAHLTGWNIMYELYANLILACLIYFVIVLLLRETSDLIYASFPFWSSLLFSWIVFSTVQFENWLWGWQVPWFLTVLALLVAVWAFTMWPKKLPRWQRLLVGLLSAVIGSFSLSSGLLIWIVCGFILLVQEGLTRYFFVWTASALLTFIVYFLNYTKPAQHPSLLYFVENPGEYVRYVLIYIGSFLSPSHRGSSWIGFLLIGLFIAGAVYLARRHRGLLKGLTAWVAVGLYVLLTAVATGIARVGFGSEQAYASRYTTISMLFVMATVVIVSAAGMALVGGRAHPERWHVLFAGAGGTLLIALFALSYFSGLQNMSLTSSYREIVKNCLHYLSSETDPCLRLIYPEGERVLKSAAFLRRLEWAGIKPPPILPSATVMNPTPNVGWLENAIPEESAGIVEATGWAHPEDGNPDGKEVIVVSNGRILTETGIVLNRPDVAKTFSSAGFLKSGWRATFNILQLQMGVNSITAYLVLDKQTVIKLNGTGTITVNR